MRTLASIYLASLSNAYRHAYLAWSAIQPVEEEGRKTKWKNSLPQALSRYHFQAACTRDWCRLRMHWSKLLPASPAPPACTMPQHSPTGNDILYTIFIGHWYYHTYQYNRPALTYISSIWGWLRLAPITVHATLWYCCAVFSLTPTKTSWLPCNSPHQSYCIVSGFLAIVLCETKSGIPS